MSKITHYQLPPAITSLDFRERRLILKAAVTAGALASVSFSGGTAIAQITMNNLNIPNAGGQPQMPFREVTQLEEDKRKVVVFFTFDCPYSYLYDTMLWRWGRTLPEGWSIHFMPLFTKEPSSIAGLKIFYAAQKADPVKLEMFMSHTFLAIQSEKRSAMTQKTWLDILTAAEINFEAFSEAWSALPSNETLVAPVVERASHYSLEVTPSVAVDGRYVITPDHTNGNPELFMALLNGMVSKAAGYA